MRVVAITDIHSSLRNIEKLADIIEDEDVDLIVIAGDITHFGSIATAKRILDPLIRTSIPVFFVPGNCDPLELLEWEDPSHKIFNLHGKLRSLSGYYFAGVGGGIKSPFNTFIEYSEDDYYKLLERAAGDLKDYTRLVLIVHNPPYNTQLDIVRSGIHVGSRSVRAFIERKQPLLVITGHIHESRGIDSLGKTVMVNPGPLKWGYYAVISLNNKRIDIELRNL